MIAAYHGYKDIVKVLLEKGADVNAKNDKDDTALMLLTAKEVTDIEIVKWLLEAGADVNAKNQYGNTALIWATKNGYTEIVELLLEYGADVSIKNNKDEDALDFALNVKQDTKLYKLLSKKYGTTHKTESIEQKETKSVLIEPLDKEEYINVNLVLFREYTSLLKTKAMFKDDDPQEWKEYIEDQINELARIQNKIHKIIMALAENKTEEQE